MKEQFLSFRVPGQISIHALRMEGNRSSTPGLMAAGFLSTPSAWRATMTSINGAKSTRNFYPRPPRRGRQKSTIGVNHSLQTAVLFPRDSNRRFVENTHADWVQAQPASRRQATCVRTLSFDYQKPTTRLSAASCRPGTDFAPTSVAEGKRPARER